MNVINRPALLVRPKEPYVQWANSFAETDTAVSLEEHRRECTIYLVQEVMNDKHLEQILKGNYRVIFDQELAAWMVDKSTWPANKDYETFLEWFDIECHSIVRDLVDKEVFSEPFNA